jgi:hypothetical protein
VPSDAAESLSSALTRNIRTLSCYGVAGALAGETWPWIADRSPGWLACAGIRRSVQSGSWSRSG